MRNSRRFAEGKEAEFLSMLEELVQIPAPSYKEEKRFVWCRNWLSSKNIPCEADEDGNIYIPWKIRKGRKNRMIIAHADTVFDDTVPLTLKKEGTIWKCPGIGDNTANVILLLLLAEYLYKTDPETETGLWLVIDRCEEGLGNLAGARKAADVLEGRLDAVLGIDLNRDAVYIDCIGSVRYEIKAKTPGGHSYGNFGNTNAIAVLSELIHLLYQYRTPENTTYNVGKISGGTSVNTIAQDASMLFEYRSDSEEEMKKGKAYLASCINEVSKLPDTEISCRIVGERPCRKQLFGTEKESLDRRISEIADGCIQAISGACGMNPQKKKASTDCNIPLSLGIPGVCTGFLVSGGPHTREEWIDVSSAVSAIDAAVSAMLFFLSLSENH